MAERIRAFDWAASPLGPVEHWPACLKAVAELVIAAPFASVLLWGRGHIVVAYNEGYRTILNDKPEPLGRPVLDVWAEERDLLAPQLARVLAGETLTFKEQTMSLKRGFDSDASWFDYGYGPVRDDSGAVVGIVVTIDEITHWMASIRSARESEARQAFWLRLGDALRPLSEPVAVQDRACAILAEHLKVDRAYYVDLDDTAGMARVDRDSLRGEARSLAGEHRMTDYGWSVEILRGGESYAIADTQDSALVPPADRSAAAALDIVANMCAPLMKDGRLIGALCVSDARPRDWSDGELDLLRETAERIWAEIQRARAEAARFRSEARYVTLFDAIDSGFCIIEMIFDAHGRAIDYRFVEANPAFERQSGLLGAVGHRISEFAPDLERHWFDRYGRVALTGEPLRIEGEAAPLGRWFDINAFRVGAPEQRRVAVLFTDISARRKPTGRCARARNAGGSSPTPPPT